MTNGMHRCIICGLKRQQGLVLRDHFICEECEKTIVSTSPKDEAYTLLVQRVKQLWMDESQTEDVGSDVSVGKHD